MTSILLNAFVLTLSLVQLRRFLRGRREPIPPSCRQCGYDVSQRPVGSERCSECGADLTPTDAIVTDRRHHHRYLTPICAASSLLLLFVLVVNVWNFQWRTWFVRNAPLPALRWMAQRDLGKSGDAMRQDWIDRGPPNEQVWDHLLDVQATGDPSYEARWDHLLGRSYVHSEMTAAQRDRYAKQLFAPPPTWRVRTPLRVGDDLCLEVNMPTVGTFGGRASEKDFFAAALDKPAMPTERNWMSGSFRQHAAYTRDLAYLTGGPVTPGPHKLHLAVRREFRESGQGDESEPIAPPHVITAVLDIEVLPADAAIGMPKPDPAKADEVAKAVTVGVYHWHDKRCFAEVNLTSAATVDRSFVVYAVLDGVPKRIGTVCAKAGAKGHSQTLYVPVTVPQAEAMRTLTIKLVGDGDGLTRSLDQNDYWPGTITFADVPLGTFKDWQQDVSDPSVDPKTRPYTIDLK